MRDRKPYPLSRVHRLISSGPVVMVTTARAGRMNVMPMAWHTMMDFDPPLIGCVIDGASLTFSTLKATKECAVNIPSATLLRKIMRCGGVTGRRVDKFRAFGLTPLSGKKVSSPLIGECFANLECRVADARMAKKYNFFVLEVVGAWIDPRVKSPTTVHHLGKGKFMTAGKTVTVSPHVK